MSWEIRLNPWSIVFSVFSPIRNLLQSELSRPSLFFFFCSCSHTVYGYTWIGSRHGISRRPLPKLSHVRWKVQNMSAYCYLFSKSFYGEIHARRCLEALSEAIVRYSLNFMKVVLWKSTSRLPPNSRKTSTRAEDPIITVSKRRWHRHNVRTISASINA